MAKINVDLDFNLSVEDIAKEVATLLLPDVIAIFKKEIEKAKGAKNELPMYMKPSKAKELFGIGSDSIRKMVKLGKINGYYPTSDLIVKVSEVVDFFESNKIEEYD